MDISIGVVMVSVDGKEEDLLAGKTVEGGSRPIGKDTVIGNHFHMASTVIGKERDVSQGVSSRNRSPHITIFSAPLQTETDAWSGRCSPVRRRDISGLQKDLFRRDESQSPTIAWGSRRLL
jgi:hypothetical protein